VSNTSPATCGSSCSACSAPSGGNATCDGTSCGVACTQGFHACGAGCSANNNVNSCGNSSCSPCPVPANGSATCNGATCGIACNQDFHPCGTACVSNTSVNSCGNSCSACAAPANGTATCNGTSCGIGCANGLSACGNACADLGSDPNNCGVCGHSCRGGSCSGGTCAPTVLASNENVNSFALGASDVFYNGATQLRSVSKLGGSPQTLFDTSSGTAPSSIRGLAADGNVVFFGVEVNQSSPQIFQISPGREFVFNGLTQVGELDNLVVSAGFLYWADNGSFWRAPTTQSDGIQRIGDASSDPLVVAGGCVYATRFPGGGGQLQLVRVCPGGSPQVQLTSDNFSDLATDNLAVYFIDGANAVRRIGLTGSPPSATTIVTPTSGDDVIGLAVDDTFAYYAEGTPGFMTCTTNWTINRIPKSGGAVVPLVKPPINCPTLMATDDQFLYVAAVGDNANNTATIFKVPK
jgi:hypothetical protein